MSDPEEWRALLAREPDAIGPIASTVPDLPEVRRRWSERLAELFATYDANLETLAAQRARARLPSTAKRLRRLAAGLAANRAELQEIFEELGITPKKPSRKPGRARAVIGEASLLAQYPQILRDWAWPDTDENRTAFELVDAGLEGVALGQGVVLGCGAGRLTVDLARRPGTERLIAVDVDPLVLAVLHRMLEKRKTTLHELPRQPRTVTDAARVWTLNPPAALEAEVVPLFADGRAPGLRDGSFDSVICPWYLDQVQGSVGAALDVAYNLLRPGGSLVHFGPLLHRADREPAEQLTIEELEEAFEIHGLAIAQQHSARIPYLRSPLSASSREIEVYVLRGVRDDGPVRDVRPPPAWLTDDRAPVPRPDGLETIRPPNKIVAEVIRLIDGRRSVHDISLRLRKKLRLEGNLVADTRATIVELYRLIQPRG